MTGEGEGRREGGERSPEEEFAEFVEYLKEKYPDGGIKDRFREKDSVRSEESVEDSSKSAQGSHAEQHDENGVEEGDARKLEANNEGRRDEEFERLWERIKKRLESLGVDERYDLDQEKRNPGEGPLEARAKDDAKEEPRAPNEWLGRESEAAQNPDLDGRGEGAEENRTDSVGKGESQEDIRQHLERDVRVSMERSTAADRNVASGEIEGKIESPNSDKGPTDTRAEADSGEPLQLGVPKVAEDLRGTQGIRDQLVERSQGQRSRDENVVSSREVVHANEELRPTREALQERIDSSPVLTATKLEEHKASNAGDGAGYQREPGKEPIGDVESPALSEDLKTLRKLQSDGALPEARVGNEGFYRKEIVDLDKVTGPSQGGKDTRLFERGTVHNETDGRPYVPYARKGPFEVGDSIPVKANLTGNPPLIRFDVLKSHIESVSGVKIDHNKLYEIKGSVKGAYDFDIYRTVGKYVYLSPSLEQRDKFQPGRVYDVSVKSVVEVPLTDAQREILGGPQKRGAWRSTMYKINHAMGEGQRVRTTTDEGKESQTKRSESILPEKIENLNATWILEARLHKWSEPRCQFNINGSEFERMTGVCVEEMRDYVVKGRIDGVGDFQKTLHRCAAGQHIPIYVPAKLQNKIETGRMYRITIDSIEKLPPRKGNEEADSIHWTWRDVAAWVDAEGWIAAKLRQGGNYGVHVTQKERKMLEGLGRFLESEGFHSRMTLNKNDGVYQIHVDAADQAARVIKNIEPFIRTVRKKEQIANFKESITRPRKNLWPSIRIAREILGLTEN